MLKGGINFAGAPTVFCKCRSFSYICLHCFRKGKVHRAVIALVGAALIVATKILDTEEAVQAIGFNTLGLLVGMMIIVGRKLANYQKM